MEKVAFVVGYLLTQIIFIVYLNKKREENARFILKGIRIMLEAQEKGEHLPILQTLKQAKGKAYNPSQDIDLKLKGEFVEMFE